VTFFFGADRCIFTKGEADWSSAEEMIQILTAALGALKITSGAEVTTQKTEVSLHLQPKIKSFLEILGRFLSPAIQALDGAKAKTGASVVKWEKRRVVVDGSAALANAVFLKFEREFDGQTDFEKIAIQLKSDEDAIFKMLDVEEEI